MKKPLISVIVTTKNNHATLDACLRSIADQSYSNVELLVIDNHSTDDTQAIAKQYTKHVFSKGPERSAQRNFGAKRAKGQYILIIDSDMELGRQVVAQCAEVMAGNPSVKSLVVPEESFGEGFWAQCKHLERSFYVGQPNIEAARLFDKKTYLKLGGYSEQLTGGEDWDLTERCKREGEVGRIEAFIRHNEGHPHFLRTVRKMYYYGRHAGAYFQQNPDVSPVTAPSGPLSRYKLFFSRPGKLFRNPVIGVGMLVLKTAEYAGGGLGYLGARFIKEK
jgi:glycosyltransferase involved in cell wall biosynthesis